jgi:hypothetical protein
MEFVTVQCPVCFEFVEMELDPQSVGEMVHDCSVCCHPWTVFVKRKNDGSPVVRVRAE